MQIASALQAAHKAGIIHRDIKPENVIGTVAYMSPEQARGNAVDARTDLFSLGVVLYEMLTGCPPFTGETISHTIVAILEKEPPLAVIGQSFPAEIEQIVKQALAKGVEKRWKSASALLADLRKLKQLLEFEADLVVTSPALPANETQTQILQGRTSELATTANLPGL